MSTGNREQGAGSRSQDEFEAALIRAMRPVAVSPELTAKLMAIADAPAVAPKAGKLVVMRPKAKVWFSGAIAAALVAGVFVAQDVHERREQRAMANQQFALSVQIEEKAMEHTRQQLEKAGVPLE
jgi:hypothetical protein